MPSLWNRILNRPEPVLCAFSPAPALPMSDVREQVNNPQTFAQTIIDEDRGWRALISGGIRELTWAQIIDNLNTVTDFYRTNPLAFRLVQLQVDHVLGDGMALKSDDPGVQDAIDEWWHDPLNNLDVRQFEMLTALTMDGEIFVTEHVNPYSGSTYIRLVPAGLVDRIETNPDDLEDEWRYHQTAQPITPDTLMRLPSAVQAQGRWWGNPDLDLRREDLAGVLGYGSGPGMLQNLLGDTSVPADVGGGYMRHFAVNRPAGVVRGQSDLAPLLPWLRRYRDWLTDRVRLNKYRTAFVWQVQLKGADARAVRQRQAELAIPPPPGSVIVANENETWTAVQANLHATDVQADGLALRLMIAAGAGIPLFWLAEAEHTARGTAAEMSEPTYRHYRQRQLYFGFAMRRLCLDALHRKDEFADLRMDDILAEFSELDKSEALFTAAAASQLSETLGTAVANGWMTDGEAARAYQHYIGLDMDLPAGDEGTAGDPSLVGGEGKEKGKEKENPNSKRGPYPSRAGGLKGRPAPRSQRRTQRPRSPGRAAAEPPDVGNPGSGLGSPNLGGVSADPTVRI